MLNPGLFARSNPSEYRTKSIAQNSVGLIDSFRDGLARESDFLATVVARFSAAQICVLRLEGFVPVSGSFHRLGTEPWKWC